VQFVRHACDRRKRETGRRAQSSGSLRTGVGDEDAVGESMQLGGPGPEARAAGATLTRLFPKLFPIDICLRRSIASTR
jgi:hypothetical protein